MMSKTMLNKSLLSSLVLALVLSACKSTPMVEKPAAVVDKSPVVEAAAPAPAADTSGIK
jgi:peptidoglycan-associated lipoprotein